MRSVILTSACLLGLAGISVDSDRERPVRADPFDGAVEVKLDDFFKRPVGPKCLEYTEAVLALEGKRVRIDGYMVRQSEPSPGVFLLAPFPMSLHELEYGLCDDLPASTLHVHLQGAEAVFFKAMQVLTTGAFSPFDDFEEK